MPRQRWIDSVGWVVAVALMALIVVAVVMWAGGCKAFLNPWGGIPDRPPIGPMPGISEGLAVLTWIMVGGFLASAACTVLCILTGSVPFLSRLGAPLFGGGAVAFLGVALAAMVLKYLVGTYRWVLIGGCLFALVLYAYGHRYVLEEKFGIDFTRDGFVGKRAERIAANPRQKRLTIMAAKKRTKR